MSTWAQILDRAAAVGLNDSARAVYDDATLLPHLNTALIELQEVFELNNIPVTNEVSDVITVPDGTTVIGFTTTPALPADLVEIQQLFESPVDQEIWTPVTRREFLTPSIVGVTPVSIFGVWSWMDQEIHVPEAVADIDLKIDYIKSIFSNVTIGDIDDDNTILNTDSFLQFRVAGLAAEFIEENMQRADKNNLFAIGGLERSLGVSVKGKQSISVRRRPFRWAFKRRRTWF